MGWWGSRGIVHLLISHFLPLCLHICMEWGDRATVPKEVFKNREMQELWAHIETRGGGIVKLCVPDSGTLVFGNPKCMI